MSSFLELECMNNTEKYEALIFGLQKAIKLDVSIFKFVGD